MGRPNSAHFDGTLVPGRSRPQHQNLTNAVQQNRPLFDNVVGAAEQRELNRSALLIGLLADVATVSVRSDLQVPASQRP